MTIPIEGQTIQYTTYSTPGLLNLINITTIKPPHMKQANPNSTVLLPSLTMLVIYRQLARLKRVHLSFWIPALMMALLFAVITSAKSRRMGTRQNPSAVIGDNNKQYQ
jgi:hypothetical protein